MSATRIWTVTYNADDNPDRYAARCRVVGQDIEMCTSDLIVSRTYSKIRREMQRRGLARIPRDENDVPCIVEVWL